MCVRLCEWVNVTWSKRKDAKERWKTGRFQKEKQKNVRQEGKVAGSRKINQINHPFICWS